LLIVDNWPSDEVEWLTAPWHPDYPEMGSRQISFSRRLYIERSDFAVNPPAGYRRLAPGRNVRLRYGFIVCCHEPEYDSDGNIRAVHCSFYTNSRSGQDKSGIKTKGVVHWLDSSSALSAEIRLYNPLFTDSNPNAAPDVRSILNPESLTVCRQALVEPALSSQPSNQPVQFERVGYFVCDSKDSQPASQVFNRIVSLRQSQDRKRQENKAAFRQGIQQTTGG